MLRTFSRGWILALLAVTAMGALPAASRAQSRDAGRPWLGVYTQSLTRELRESLDLDEGDGVLVSRVVAGSPAERAGVRQGDVILSFNSRTVTSSEQLSDLVAGAEVGQSVALQIARNGNVRSLEVELEARPAAGERREAWDTPVPRVPSAPPAPRAPRAPAPPRADDDDDDRRDGTREFEFETDPDDDGDVRVFRWKRDDGTPGVRRFELDRDGMPGMGLMGRGRLGVTVEDADSDQARELGVARREGALVTQVLDDTPAERAGLRAGDVVTRVDDTPVRDSDDLVRAIRTAGANVTLTVVRRGTTRTMDVELGARSRGTRMQGIDPDRLREQIRREIRTPRTPRTERRLSDSEREEMRREIQELRREIEALRRELESERDRN